MRNNCMRQNTFGMYCRLKPGNKLVNIFTRKFEFYEEDKIHHLQWITDMGDSMLLAEQQSNEGP